MSDFVIIPDTSCDLTADLRDRFDIPDYLKGIIYFPDGRSEYASLDWDYFTPTEFYNSMSKKNSLYKTATPTIGHITELWEQYLNDGKDILCITLSSGLSGTYQTCLLVQNKLAPLYPERKIICIDSLRYSTALSLLVMLASIKKANGATIDETAAFLEANKHRIHQIGPMDDLFFLMKTGRVSTPAAFFGTLIGINPVADFNRQGRSEVLYKFKGKRSALQASLEYMKSTIENPAEQTIFVAHSNREKAAELFADMIQKEFAPKEIIINDIGMACGASIGPGLCAAFYVGREISEDYSFEKELMSGIATSMK